MAAWDLHSGVSYYDQLHSDLIDTAARRGLVGLASLLMLYGVPLLLFARALRGRPDATTRALAVAGLVVVVAFIGFGLTQSMLRDARGLAGYLGLITACWCLLRTRPELIPASRQGVRLKAGVRPCLLPVLGRTRLQSYRTPS